MISRVYGGIAAPAGAARLPPQARVDRGPPHDRLRRPLAVSRWIEARTGRSIRKFVRTARRYRSIQTRLTGIIIITAADPVSDYFRQVSFYRHS